MKKYFVSADIHGFFDEWKAALDEKGFDVSNAEHVLVVLGDLLDRGKQPQEILNFILSIPAERTVIIRGNHEDLLVDMLGRGYPESQDIFNGTWKTVSTLTKNGKAGFYDDPAVVCRRMRATGYFDVLKRAVDYYELDEYVFVHGWIPILEDYSDFNNAEKRPHSYREDWRQASSEDWKDARWLNGMAAWADGIREKGKIIVCGHYHARYGHAKLHNIGEEDGENAIDLPFIDDGIIALDACTAISGRVNVFVIADK